MNYKAIETRKSELMRNFREVCAAGNRLLCLISRGLAMTASWAGIPAGKAAFLWIATFHENL